jgi:hypothetical protein
MTTPQVHFRWPALFPGRPDGSSRHIAMKKDLRAFNKRNIGEVIIYALSYTTTSMQSSTSACPTRPAPTVRS